MIDRFVNQSVYIPPTKIRPYYYDSDEANRDSAIESITEYTESTRGSITTEFEDIDADNDLIVDDVSEDVMYFGMTVIIEKDDGTQMFALDTALNIESVYYHGIPHIYDYFDIVCGKPSSFDIIQIVYDKIDEYEITAVIIKTYWIRLIQRHWKLRFKQQQKSLRGLMSYYIHTNDT